MDKTDKEIVWLPIDLAKKVKDAESTKELDALIIGYLDESRGEVKANLESLDADLLQYRAMMTKAKVAFREAKDEQCTASYELWENFDKELPKVKEKIMRIVRILNPLSKQLKEIDDLMRKINTYQLEKVAELLSRIENASPALLKAIGLFVSEERGE